MKAQDYWRKRVLYAKKQRLKGSAQYEDAMRSRLQDLENEFEKEAFKYLQLYANTNNTNIQNAAKYLSSIDTSKFDMTLAEFEAKAKAGGYERELNSAYYKSRIARLQQLHKQYSELAAKYANNESDRMGLELAKQYKGTYELENYNKYLVMGGLDIEFAHFNEQQLKDIVYQPWQGSNFSKRIWKNYTKRLPDMLTDSILRATLMGYSYERTTLMMRDKLTQFSNTNLHRLVFTEMGHVQEQATAEFYKDSKIEQYEYLATLESHTCDQCAHLDERIFYVKDKIEGLNYPLIHPYCRCTTVPYDPALPDVQSRWYRDPITGKGKWTNGKMPFDQWKKATNVKPLSKQKFINAKPRPLLLAEPKTESKVSKINPFYETKDFANIKDNIEQEKIFNDESNKWFNNLHESEREAIGDYVSSSEGLNFWLGNGKKFSDEDYERFDKDILEQTAKINQQRYEELTSAINKNTVKEDFITERWVNEKEYNIYKELADKEEKGTFSRFKSTSPFSGNFRSDYKITYYVPKGTKGVFLGTDAARTFADEKEFLVRDRQDFYVKEKDGELYVYIQKSNKND